jgi:hypothetical protein
MQVLIMIKPNRKGYKKDILVGLVINQNALFDNDCRKILKLFVDDQIQGSYFFL